MSGKEGVLISVVGPGSEGMAKALASVFKTAGIEVQSRCDSSLCVAVDERDIAVLASGHPAKEARPVDYLTAYGASIQPLASATPSQPALDAVALAALVVGSECHDKGSPVMTVARRVLVNAGVLPHSGGKLADLSKSSS